MVAVKQSRFTAEEALPDGRGEPAPEAAAFYAAWPVNWSGISIGALAAISAVAVFGLIGTALGAYLVDPASRVVDLQKVGFFTIVASVCSAFFAFVIGGWVAASIAGIRRSEPAMLHGAIAWLLAVPLLIALAALGAGSYFGGWHGGLAGRPTWTDASATPFVQPQPLDAYATATEIREHRAAMADYRERVDRWHDETPRATRNAALGAVSALLLGLVGSVIGGWMASGQPMTVKFQDFYFYRARAAQPSSEA